MKNFLLLLILLKQNRQLIFSPKIPCDLVAEPRQLAGRGEFDNSSLVPRGGLEPPTFCLKGNYSTIELAGPDKIKNEK